MPTCADGLGFVEWKSGSAASMLFKAQNENEDWYQREALVWGNVYSGSLETCLFERLCQALFAHQGR